MFFFYLSLPTDPNKNRYSNVTVDAGSGDDTIENQSSNGSIVAGAGNDSIINNGGSDNMHVTIDCGTGNDYVLQEGDSYISVNGGDGDDTIDNSAGYNDITLLGGDGNDYIQNWTFGERITIEGGAGNDYIFNRGKNLLLKGGADSDTIVTGSNQFGGKNVTIEGGTGNDLIVLEAYAADNLIHYESGDGFDIIRGFKTNSTLKLGDGTQTYSRLKSGSDVILTVDNGKITLVGAASLTSVNITGEEIQAIAASLRLDGTRAIYGTENETLFTIHGISESAQLTDFVITGTTVTVSKNALGKANLFIEGEGYTLELAQDVPKTSTETPAAWSKLVNNTATYTATAYSDYYTLDGNNVIYHETSGGEQFTLTGIKSVAEIDIVVDEENKTVKLNAAALGTETVTFAGEDFSFVLGEEVVKSPGESDSKFTSFEDGTAAYKVSGEKAYYTLAGNEISYMAATSDKEFTISGLAQNLTLADGELEGVTVESDDEIKFVLSAEALKNSNVTLSGTGATLELDGKVAQQAENISGAWEVTNGTATYCTNGKSKYYTLGMNQIFYHAAEAGERNIELSGLAETVTSDEGTIDGLGVDENSLTISGNIVDKNLIVNFNKNNLAINIDKDVENISVTGTDDADEFNIGGKNVTVTGGKGADVIDMSAGGVIPYASGDGNDVIEGFNATSTLSISGGTYSTAVSGSDIIVKVGNGSITLKDAANLTTLNIDGTQAEVVPYTLPAGLSVDDDTLKVSTKFTGKKIDASDLPIEDIDASEFKKPLQIVGNSSDNTITGGTGNDILTGGGGANTFAMSGGKDVVTDYTANKDKIFVESAPSVTVNNKTGDTVIQVGKNSLTLKKLNGENLSKGKTITFTDGANETTQTYFSDRVVDGDSVTLQPAFKGTFDGSDFDKIDASNAKAGVKIIGGDSSSVLGSAKNDTLSGATLTGGKGSDIFIASGTATITDYETSDKISLDSAISDVKIDGKNVVLSFGDDTLTIEKGADKKVTLLNGKKSTPYIFGKHTIFDGSKKSVTLTAGNEFDASSYSALVTIDASQTDGIEIRDNAKANKITFGDGKNVFVWAKGNDTIYNFDTDDTLKISGVVTDASVTKKGATVLNVGKSKLTFDNTTEVKFTDSSGTKIFSAGIFCDAGETSATLPANFSQNTKTQLALDYATIDASNVKKALNISLGTGNDSIHGGKKGDSIHGGSGNDTLWGGGGNDSLWGDAGADKFIWQKGDGKDVIFGFDDNDMLEIIGLGGKVTGTFNKAGTELTVKVGNTAVAVLKNFTATTFNVNGNDYQISGSKLVKS